MIRFLSLSLLLLCLAVAPLRAQTAFVQVVHNAADPALTPVDIYVMGSLAQSNINFRDVTPFLTLPSGMVVNIEVKPAGSGTTIYSQNIGPLTTGAEYILMASGVGTPANFTANPDAASIAVNIFETAGREVGQNGPTNVDLLVYHGATDAPTVDVVVRGSGTTLIDDISYSDFQGYATVPAGTYVLDVYNSTQTVLLASYLADLSALGGGAATVFASGFLDDSQGPGFGLYVALGNASANGPALQLPLYAPKANLQVIHNAADPAAASVDVYVNGTLAVSGFDFRDATPFIELDAGLPVEIEITPAGSTTVVYTLNLDSLEQNTNYIAVANGVLTPANFTANPDAVSIGFDLYATDEGRVTGQNGSTNVDLLVFHGATDAPTVDVVVRGGATLIDDISYTDFVGYGTVPAGNYILDVYNSDQTTLLASYVADLTTLGGQAATVFASGFLDTTQGEGFGLFVALGGQSATGQTIELPLYVQGPSGNAMVQVIHNVADPAADTVDVYVNGNLVLNNLRYLGVSNFVSVPSGMPVTISITPATSTTPLYTLNLDSLEVNKNYIAFASGVANPGSFTANPDGVSIALDLIVFDEGRIGGTGGTGNADILVYHGSTDAPTVDVSVRGGSVLANDLSYTDFNPTGYATIPASEYILDIYDATGTNLLLSYYADLSTAANIPGGAAAVVFASGFYNQGQGADFGLYVAIAGLPSTTQAIKLPLVENARVQVIHNSAHPAADTVDVYVISRADGEIIATLDDFTFRSATPYVTLPSNLPLILAVAPGNSTGPGDSIASYQVTLESGSTTVIVAAGLVDTVGFRPSPSGVNTDFNLFFHQGKEAADDTTTLEVLTFHGGTDAPTVEVVAQGLGVVVGDITYGEFIGYSVFQPSTYVLDVNVAVGHETAYSYLAELEALVGQAIVVFASGFLDAAQGPLFGLWVAQEDGTTFPLPLFTSINERNFTGKLNLYPNPTSSNINISLSLDEAQTISVKVVNTLGQVVAGSEFGMLNSGDNTINMEVSSLNAGMYIVNIALGNGQQVNRPLIVE